MASFLLILTIIQRESPPRILKVAILLMSIDSINTLWQPLLTGLISYVTLSISNDFSKGKSSFKLILVLVYL